MKVQVVKADAVDKELGIKVGMIGEVVEDDGYFLKVQVGGELQFLERKNVREV